MGTIITNKGLSKLASATVENPIVITHFAVGDGGGKSINPNEYMESLINEKYRDYINDKYANGNNTTIECVLRANAPIEEGFYIRELGIFDIEGDLIAVANTPEQYRPATESGISTE
ncbi:MAG: phage tail protein [Alphaproteobacteria bacterium]|jgi:phage-related tail fiber protein|nr:phage tail protein [Alphaproteobacteria bacterium]